MKKNTKVEPLNESPLKTIGTAKSAAKAVGPSVMNQTMGFHANGVKNATMGCAPKSK